MLETINISLINSISMSRVLYLIKRNYKAIFSCCYRHKAINLLKYGFFETNHNYRKNLGHCLDS